MHEVTLFTEKKVLLRDNRWYRLNHFGQIMQLKGKILRLKEKSEVKEKKLFNLAKGDSLLRPKRLRLK